MADPIKTAKRIFDEFLSKADPVAHTSQSMTPTASQDRQGQTRLDKETLSRAMAEIGRKGGKIGGKRRLKTLTAARRRQIARKAARSRWKKTRH